MLPARNGLVCYAAVLAVAVLLIRTIDAQDGPQLLLTADRAQAYVEAAEHQLDYLPGEVVVKFRNGVGTAGQDRALAGVRSRPSSDDLDWAGPVAILRDASQPNARILADQLRLQPEVEYAEPNYLVRLPSRSRFRPEALTDRDLEASPRATTPNDPGYSARQWNLTALDMPRAWDINPGGKPTITVAVVDTGITTVTETRTFSNWNGTAIVNQNMAFATNPDLSSTRLVAPRDFVFLTAGTPVLDMDGHGTHVSATIGEDTNNDLSDAGIAYRVQIMPVKVCIGYWEVQIARSASGTPGPVPIDSGGCPNSAIAQGIRYAADNGAQVINLSLGGDSSSQTILDAIRYAIGKGAFVAAAVGNEFEEGNPTEYPAGDAPSIDGLMSVAAVGRSLTKAFYSNTGSWVEIAAPGGSSRDTSLGTGSIWQSTLFFPDQDPTLTRTPRFDRYLEIGYTGTSMATPHVSGLAALLISQGITSPAAVEAMIRRTAKDLGAKGKDDEFGYGLIQPRMALFGLGLVK
jgi:serine protease